MPNYYEILKVRPAASTTEIEIALDEQYNQWRRLVTHHDPSVVNQANQALQALEQIRTTLTDPAKRSGYDIAIGLAGTQIGGLADPSALLKTLEPMKLIPPVGSGASNASAKQDAPPQSVRRTDAWICPKCKTANALGMQFCGSCGGKIGHNCPNCERMTELTNPFCPHCGADKRKVYLQRQEDYKKEQASEIRNLQHQIVQEQKNIAVWEKAGKSFFPIGLNKQEQICFGALNRGLGCGVLAIVLGVFLMVWWVYVDFILVALSLQVSTFAVLMGPVIGLVGALCIMLPFRVQKARDTVANIQEQIADLEKQIRKIQAENYPGEW